MYKVLIKIDGEYLYMLEAFENGSMDIVSLLVIIYCISIAYRKRYSLTVSDEYDYVHDLQGTSN